MYELLNVFFFFLDFEMSENLEAHVNSSNSVHFNMAI